MKLTKGVKLILVEELGKELERRVSIKDMNVAILFLDRFNSFYKVIAYGVFENPDMYERLHSTQESRLFEKWLDMETGTIPVDYNKGRKLTRLLQNFVKTYQHILPFNFAVEGLFKTVLTSFFVKDTLDDIPFVFSVDEEEEFFEQLYEIRKYLACFFLLEMATDSVTSDAILKTFIQDRDSRLYEKLMEQSVLIDIADIGN